jgi:nucleotide-binding universal stress UspA family protein
VLYGDAPFLAMQQLGDEIRSNAGNSMSSAIADLNRQMPGIAVTPLIVQGVPATEILKAAGHTNAELIVMGTKGLTAMERLLIGSTSERVFHHAACPVLCVPPDTTYQGIHRIAFATDLQEDNLHAASGITDFARKFGAEMQFIYIDTEKGETRELSTVEITEKIRMHVNYPKMAGYIMDNTDVARGIQGFLSKYQSDILVMFTHHRSFPRSLINPSITSRTLHDLHIPLLVLPQQQHA